MEGLPDPLSPTLESVVARCAEMVRRVGSRHGLSADDLDELFQAVRIRLWRALETGERIKAVSTSYVYRTAMSAALDLLRQRRARREDRVDLSRPSGEATLGASPSPEESLQRQELAERVYQAVEGLSETRRLVVRLYLSGHYPGEISRLLGWSEAKARNLVYRGLSDLRARLAQEGLDPEKPQ